MSNNNENIRQINNVDVVYCMINVDYLLALPSHDKHSNNYDGQDTNSHQGQSNVQGAVWRPGFVFTRHINYAFSC